MVKRSDEGNTGWISGRIHFKVLAGLGTAGLYPTSQRRAG